MKNVHNRKMNVMVITKESKDNCWIYNLLTRYSSTSSVVNISPIMRLQYNINITCLGESDDYMALFKSYHPDLILIDLGLGKKFSENIIQEIRTIEGQRHTGIVFFCNTSEHESTSVECLELGADDFLRFECTEREVVARVNSVLRLKSMTDELRNVNHKLQKLSNTDDLTGLYNMRAFEGLYSNAIKNCMSGNANLAVFMLDLDYFKTVNDSINHLMGSYVISEVGKKLNTPTILSSCDFAARYGGDEYVVVTHDASFESAMQRSEYMREIIKNSVFTKEDNSVKITVSIGVAWVKSRYQGKEEDPIKAADILLYESKNLGRDRTTGITLNNASDFSAICVDKNFNHSGVVEDIYDPSFSYRLSNKRR
jgi:diguanylate cyclase (GGDEF)-like protein